MKVKIHLWRGGLKNLPSWCVNDSETELDLYKIQQILDSGNNIMITTFQNELTLCIDSRTFSQCG